MLRASRVRASERAKLMKQVPLPVAPSAGLHDHRDSRLVASPSCGAYKTRAKFANHQVDYMEREVYHPMERQRDLRVAFQTPP